MKKAYFMLPFKIHVNFEKILEKKFQKVYREF